MRSRAATAQTDRENHDQLILLIEEATEIEILQYEHIPANDKDTYLLFRFSIRQHASEDDYCPDALSNNRQDLQKAINKWRSRYQKLFPRSPPHPLADHPENEILELPSSYNANCFQQFDLTTLARLEYEIRLGYAYDSIDDIRSAIHIYNVSNHEKRTQVFGQRPTTRAWAVLNSLRDNIRECANRYRLSYSALVTLGLPGDSELKPIGDQDLWGKNMTSTSKQGDSKRKEPWYWVIGKPRDLSDDAWELECTSSLCELINWLTRTKWSAFAGSVCELPVIVIMRKSRS
jgi:hypothetical protein